jgi:hypothetical protein
MAGLRCSMWRMMNGKWGLQSTSMPCFHLDQRKTLTEWTGRTTFVCFNWCCRGGGANGTRSSPTTWRAMRHGHRFDHAIEARIGSQDLPPFGLLLIIYVSSDSDRHGSLDMLASTRWSATRPGIKDRLYAN